MNNWWSLRKNKKKNSTCTAQSTRTWKPKNNKWTHKSAKQTQKSPIPTTASALPKTTKPMPKSNWPNSLSKRRNWERTRRKKNVSEKNWRPIPKKKIAKTKSIFTSWREQKTPSKNSETSTFQQRSNLKTLMMRLSRRGWRLADCRVPLKTWKSGMRRVSMIVLWRRRIKRRRLKSIRRLCRNQMPCRPSLNTPERRKSAFTRTWKSRRILLNRSASALPNRRRKSRTRSVRRRSLTSRMSKPKSLNRTAKVNIKPWKTSRWNCRWNYSASRMNLKSYRRICGSWRRTVISIVQRLLRPIRIIIRVWSRLSWRIIWLPGFRRRILRLRAA